MKTKKILAGLAASVIAASMMAAVSASAAATTGYTPVHGGVVTFDKYITMENDANVPNISFDFTVAPIASVIDATDTKLKVMPGPAGIVFTSTGTDSVTVDTTDATNASVAFSASDATSPEADKDSKSIVFSTTAETTDEKFAQKTLTLDLSTVNFTEPGVYRYVITEVAATNIAGVINDSTGVRYLDVFVKDTRTGLVVDGTYLHSDDSAPLSGSTSDSSGKSTGFSNSYTTDNLIFSKTVTGNQGSKDKYFKFTVKLTNPESSTISDADVFSLTGSSIDIDPKANDATEFTAAEMKTANNVTSLTYAQLSAGYSFYLQSGNQVQISGIPSKLGYIITEEYDDYDASVTVSGDTKTGDAGTAAGTDIAGVDDPTAGTLSVSDTYLKADTVAAFTNDRGGLLPTGVILSVAAPAMISIAALAGVITIVVKRKKEEAED